MVVRNGHRSVEASEIATESHGVARDWGGCQVREWVQDWIKHHKLPESNLGCYVKVFTPLSDLVVCVELQSYVWSNKWAIDPAKLAAFMRMSWYLWKPKSMHAKLLTRRCQQNWKNMWRLSCFHAFTSRLGRGFVSAQLANGCIEKDSGIWNTARGYIMMVTTNPMFWITTRSIFCQQCSNTGHEWLNIKLKRLRLS